MTYRVEHNQSVSTNQTYQLTLLDDQHRPVGYANGELRQYAMWYNGQPCFFLNTLVITNQDHRKQGMGNQLLKAVEVFARKAGAFWVRGQLVATTTDYIQPSPDEQALKSFWTRNGYGLKREIHDESIRFWKPLPQIKAA